MLNILVKYLWQQVAENTWSTVLSGLQTDQKAFNYSVLDTVI